MPIGDKSAIMLHMRTLAYCAMPLWLLSAAVTPALAEVEPKALPAAVRVMLETAIKNDNDADIAAIAKVAEQTNPEAKAEIAAMVNAHNQTREIKRVAQVRDAGMFDLWKGRVELGGFRSTGSTDEVGLSAGFAFQRQGLKWSHKLQGSADYRRANGATSRERFVLSYEPRYQFDPKGFVYGLVQYEHDPLIGYDTRVTGSAGIGYRLIQDRKIDLSMDAGPSVRHASYIDGTIEDKFGGRTSLDFGWKLAPTLTFRQNASLYVEDGVQSAAALSALESRFVPRLTARFSYTMQYEGESRFTVEGLNTLSKVTLIYDF